MKLAVDGSVGSQWLASARRECAKRARGYARRGCIPQYRGALPAWRVAIQDREGLAVYVAAGTGAVTARRSDL